MTPAGLDTKRLLQMVMYCLCAGLAAALTAWGAGATPKAALAAGAATFATSLGSYWATSPKNGQVVDAAKAKDDATTEAGFKP